MPCIYAKRARYASEAYSLRLKKYMYPTSRGGALDSPTFRSLKITQRPSFLTCAT
eukprot:m.198241 g.198241  ORF g.198241 m.198241 type:complete len:55 (-) comp15291_c0_seq4:5860-6024(-)